MVDVRLLKQSILGLALFVAIGSHSLGNLSAAEPSKARLAEMIKKAAQEGEVVYQGPDPATGLPTPDMVRDMGAVTEAHFGVKVRVKFEPAPTFPAASAKALTEIKAGGPPTFDLMYQTDMSGAALYREKAIEPVAWLDLFAHITPKDLEWNGLAVINTSYVLMPAYNTSLVKPQDVPKTWEDILDPKWKSKVGLVLVPEPWIMFSQPSAWGEQKTFAYLDRLLGLSPKLGRYPEVLQRLVSGETPLAWVSQRERTLSYKEQQRAPVDVAGKVEPVLVQTNLLFVPKGARRPNAAALVAAAMLTKEGQELQLKYQNLTSMYRPNTPAAEFTSRTKVVKIAAAYFQQKGPELMKKVSDILIKK